MILFSDYLFQENRFNGMINDRIIITYTHIKFYHLFDTP